MGTRREWRAHGTARIEFVPDSDDGQCVCAGGFSLWPVHARMYAKGARARSELGVSLPHLTLTLWQTLGAPGAPFAPHKWAAASWDAHCYIYGSSHDGITPFTRRGHCTNPLKVRASRPQVSKSLRSVRVGNYSGPEGPSTPQAHGQHV